MMKSYIVYCYMWKTGHVYVGKTFSGSCRMGILSHYKGSKRVFNHWNKNGEPDLIEILEENIPNIKENKKFGLNLTSGGEHCKIDKTGKEPWNKNKTNCYTSEQLKKNERRS